MDKGLKIILIIVVIAVIVALYFISTKKAPKGNIRNMITKSENVIEGQNYNSSIFEDEE